MLRYDLWTECPIYHLVISTLLSSILSGNNTFKWHTLKQGKDRSFPVQGIISAQSH